jgi:hypothetical protein
MPSADFCLLTRYVAIQGAVGFLMRRCLFRGSLEDSYPPTANGHAGILVNRVNPFRILLMMILPHGKQISPDRNVSFPCTAAAFTLSPEPAGFVVLCQLAQGLSFVCPAHWRDPPDQVRGRLLLGALRGGTSRPFGGTSFRRSVALPPLPSARTFGSIH